MCKYQMASKAKKPRCNKCGSRQMNEIAEFSTVKEQKRAKVEAKKPQPVSNPEPEIKPKAPEEKPDTKESSDFDWFNSDNEI